MKNILEAASTWRPFNFFGIDNNLLFINREVIISTWAVLALILILGIIKLILYFFNILINLDLSKPLSK